MIEACASRQMVALLVCEKWKKNKWETELKKIKYFRLIHFIAEKMNWDQLIRLKAIANCEWVAKIKKASFVQSSQSIDHSQWSYVARSKFAKHLSFCQISNKKTEHFIYCWKHCIICSWVIQLWHFNRDSINSANYENSKMWNSHNIFIINKTR